MHLDLQSAAREVFAEAGVAQRLPQGGGRRPISRGEMSQAFRSGVVVGHEPPLDGDVALASSAPLIAHVEGAGMAARSAIPLRDLWSTVAGSKGAEPTVKHAQRSSDRRRRISDQRLEGCSSGDVKGHERLMLQVI